jgi:hypothetical protein
MLQTDSLKVFFDESGKRSNKPNLMGGLAIPSKIYYSPNFEIYSQKLKDHEIALHWNQCTGDSKIRTTIIDVISLLAKYHRTIKFNVINYDYSTLASRKAFEKDLIEKMIYTKFPERIIYGLLRGYGRNVYMETDIYIEDSTEYRAFKLNEVIKDQLNIQALYRGEQYVVENSSLVPKNVEIGVELTDLLLGIIRTVIENKSDDHSKAVKIKNGVIIELIKNDQFYAFLERIRYFEWTNAKELTEIGFNDYLQLFLASHHDKWV